MCKQYKTDLLAQIPLSESIDQAAEKGTPIVLNAQDPTSIIWNKLASKLTMQIASQPRDYRVQFPKIEVQTN